MTSHASLSTGTRHIATIYLVALLREELGRRIQTARKEAGLSQQDLAAIIGLKHAHDVSRYERGKTEVPAFRIDRIAEATNRPRSYFTRDPSEPEISEVESLRGELAEVRQGLAEIQEAMKAVGRIEDLLLSQAKRPRVPKGSS